MLTVTITNTLMSKTVNGGGVPPSNTVAPVISGSSVIGSTLTSTTGTWIGTPVITYAYQWKRNGVDIVGETNSTYVLVSADYNQAITCEVTATNAFGSASTVSNSITATATAPVNTVAPVISGSTTIGSTLSSTTGTWIGAPTPTYTYQWKRNGSDIPSATASTYVLVTADAASNITCQVTATNVAGSANATSNTLAIPGIAPVNTVAPVISGTNVVGSTLSSTTGTWTGTPTITYAYQWKRNGSNIASATSSTYTLVQADATFAITCAVTATNVAGSAEATSNALTIFDADAQAFFTASGLTGTTNQSAINQLVVDMKGYGIWTKMKAIYPMIGGTAALHKWNLKNPLDTNAAFRLVFAGGWTHSATGALPNGTNAYADTFLTPSTSLLVSSTHISYYSRTQSNLFEIDMGSSTTTFANSNKALIAIRKTGTTEFNIHAQNIYITYTDADSRAFYIGNRTASNVINGWRNNTKVATGATSTTGLSTRTFYIGAFGSQAAGQYYSTKECAFASIGDGLTDTEAANFYTAVQAYNTTLGRNV